MQSDPKLDAVFGYITIINTNIDSRNVVYGGVALLTAEMYLVEVTCVCAAEQQHVYLSTNVCCVHVVMYLQTANVRQHQG